MTDELDSTGKGDPLPPLSILRRSRQKEVLRQCALDVAGRKDNIEDLLDRTEELAALHLGEIEGSKDSQERAIYVFTVVTVIFLPLSFVSFVWQTTLQLADSVSRDRSRPPSARAQQTSAES